MGLIDLRDPELREALKPFTYNPDTDALTITATTVAIVGNLTVTGTITYGATAVPVASTYFGNLTVGINDTGYDVKFYGATAGKYWLWDEDADGIVLVGIFTQTGNMAITGTLTLTGAPTITGNMQLTGTLTIGVDDTGYDVILYGAGTGKYWKWDQDADTNGGVVLVGTSLQTGAATLIGTLTIGVNDTGHDVKFYGATSGCYFLWDESEDGIVIVGTLTMTGALAVTGAVQIIGDITVGVDATGHDVIFYAETTAYKFFWDQNQDTNGGLTIVGTLIQTGAVTITGAVGITGNVTMASTSKLYFLDTGLYIYSSTNGQLDIIADVIAKITAPTVELEGSTSVLLDGDVTVYAAHTFTTGTGGSNFLSKLTLGVSGTVLTLTAGTPLFQVMSTNNSTGTEAVQSYFESTYTGIGGIGQCLKAYLATNVAGGSYLTALYGVLDLKTAGGVTGLGSAVCAEVILPGGAAGIGTIGVLEIELGCSASWASSQAVNLIWAQAYGNATAIGLFNHSGNFMHLVGLGAADTGHIFHTVASGTGTHGLRIMIDGVGYDIMLKATGA